LAEGLYHPAHVSAALDRVDGYSAEGELSGALLITDARSDAHIPSEALVRLLRRCQVEPNRKREDLLISALLRRILNYARRAYSGLTVEDQEDLAQGLVAIIIGEVAKTTAIDFWEITFRVNLARAAADLYQEHIRPKGDELDLDIDDESERIGDDGGVSRGIVESAILKSWTAKFLTPGERKLFYLMFVEGVPIRSSRATSDVVRLTGKAEGTLREIKTNIMRKLLAALREQPL
jgi:hypothetical protein